LSAEDAVEPILTKSEKLKKNFVEKKTLIDSCLQPPTTAMMVKGAKALEVWCRRVTEGYPVS